MRFVLRVVVVASALLTAHTSWAWLRPLPNWAKLVDDAEVIVVAHIVGTPVYVAHKRPPDMGRSWEYHARLAIDEVLKGKCAAQEIPIVVQYGLSFSEYVRDGAVKRDGMGQMQAGQAIWDTGSSAVTLTALLRDAQQPAVWLLGHYPDRVGREGRPTEELSIRDPEHIQPPIMIPFFRSILRPDPIERQLVFVRDPDAGVRANALCYFTDRGERQALPLATGLTGDPDARVAHLAVRACEKLGGKDAASDLRPLLANEKGPAFYSAAQALADLHDFASTPRLVEILKAGGTPGVRASVASMLGRMGDPSAIAALVSALKDDGLADRWNGRQVWESAQRALETLTGCRLSPNGDKAPRWWAAAEGLSRDTWRHFAIGEAIASIPICGPDRQDRMSGDLAKLIPAHRDELLEALGFSRPGYAPEKVEAELRKWLGDQHWTDYLGLPSQIDDELTLKAELTAPFGSGEAVRVRYTVTNRSDRDLSLAKHCFELLRARFTSGNGLGTAFGGLPGPDTLSAGSFFRLPKGEQRVIVGQGVLSSNYELMANGPIQRIAVALRFAYQGTSVGFDAWVGEVWAEPIVVTRVTHSR